MIEARITGRRVTNRTASDSSAHMPFAPDAEEVASMWERMRRLHVTDAAKPAELSSGACSGPSNCTVKPASVGPKASETARAIWRRMLP